jgi:hypothetical protein
MMDGCSMDDDALDDACVMNYSPSTYIIKHKVRKLYNFKNKPVNSDFLMTIPIYLFSIPYSLSILSESPPKNISPVLLSVKDRLSQINIRNYIISLLQ